MGGAVPETEYTSIPRVRGAVGGEHPMSCADGRIEGAELGRGQWSRGCAAAIIQVFSSSSFEQNEWGGDEEAVRAGEGQAWHGR